MHRRACRGEPVPMVAPPMHMHAWEECQDHVHAWEERQGCTGADGNAAHDVAVSDLRVAAYVAAPAYHGAFYASRIQYIRRRANACVLADLRRALHPHQALLVPAHDSSVTRDAHADSARCGYRRSTRTRLPLYL